MIQTAGDETIAALYNGIPYEGLDLLHFRKFSTKVMSSTTAVEVHTLPPTSVAARYHCFRVYLQVKQWIEEDEGMELSNWGWAIDNGKCLPLKTTLLPAPEELLKIIRCKCKSNCDTNRCTCKKHGLECSIGCSECMGVNCQNSSTMVKHDLDLDDD